MARIEAYLLIFLTVLVDHMKSEICYVDEYNTRYCENGCCGSTEYQYCCSYSRTNGYYNYNSGGSIVGGVIGGVAGMAILICIIVCCCCCCRKQATTGQVLQPHTNLGFIVTSTTATNGTQVPLIQPLPGVHTPSFPAQPQVTERSTPYMTGNTAMNNPYGGPPPEYNDVVKTS